VFERYHASLYIFLGQELICLIMPCRKTSKLIYLNQTKSVWTVDTRKWCCLRTIVHILVLGKERTAANINYHKNGHLEAIFLGVLYWCEEETNARTNRLRNHTDWHRKWCFLLLLFFWNIKHFISIEDKSPVQKFIMLCGFLVAIALGLKLCVLY
jgi:hypothetical protein